MKRMNVRIRFRLQLRRLFRRSLREQNKQTLKNRRKEYAAVIKRKVMRNACDREIFNSCLLLKNLSVMKEEAPLSADYMLEQLKDSSFLLRHVYEDMLRDYRNGMTEEAFSRLPEAVDSRAAVLFSHILSKMDQVNPAQLTRYMQAFEESFQDARLFSEIREERWSVRQCPWRLCFRC